MQPALTLHVDGINHLDRLRRGTLLKVGLPAGRPGAWVLEEVLRERGLAHGPARG